MRILIAGASGFIGARIAQAAERAGHEVVAAGRDITQGQRLHPRWTWVDADFTRDLTPDAWTPRLAGVDAVVNCVGVLQDGGRESTQAAHVDGADALFAACEAAGVRRVVLISALGVEAPDTAAVGDETSTPYATSKLEGEARLKARDLDWVILRPSLVIARETYGGTTLLRALAGAPGVVVLAHADALFQPVHADDLAAGVLRLLEPDAPKRISLDVPGPQTMAQEDVVAATRAWLGFPAGHVLHAPNWLVWPLAWFGDLVGWIGASSALRTTSIKQMHQAAGADPAPWIAATGVTPRPFAEAMAREPAGVQDRIHARFAFARPLARVTLALFWLATGLITLGPARADAWRILADMGLATTLRSPVVELGAAIDIALGLAMLLGWRERAVGVAMIVVTLGYVGALTALAPGCWLDPLGPILKVFPAAALAGVIAITGERR